MLRRPAVSGVYIAVFIVALLGASLAAYTVGFDVASQSANLKQSQSQSLVNSLEVQNSELYRSLASGVILNNSLLGLDPVAIYNEASGSVVTVEGVQQLSSGNETVLGSGFVINLSGSYYVVTNFHVVHDVVDPTVTFQDGNSYSSTVVGTDPYSDLAIVSPSAPAAEFHPLNIIASSSLVVGQPVAVIGNPFGLSGSMTFGIVSQLGRTLSESLAGSFAIADVIQFSAPINPGNSGGPLLDAAGNVVGITTAIVGGSQGVGFAIPSDAILRELPSLVATGSYDQHSYMGISGVDMTLQLAQLSGTNYTYGVLIENLSAGGPAANAGLQGGSQTVDVQGSSYSIGGDIVIAMNGTKITSTDALSSYLTEYTLPGQQLVLTIVRGGNVTTLSLTLGTRPPPPSG